MDAFKISVGVGAQQFFVLWEFSTTRTIWILDCMGGALYCEGPTTIGMIAMQVHRKSRFATAGFVLATALAGSAGLGLAQDRQSEGAFVPEWQARLPSTGGEYPSRAMERNIGGAAILCCRPGASTSISCRVADDHPRGQHFGLAALRISERLNLTPASAAKFLENPEEIELTFIFRLTRGGIRNGTWNIEHTGVCRPTAESPTS